MRFLTSHTWIWTTFAYLTGFGIAELTDNRMAGAPTLIVGLAIAGALWVTHNGWQRAVGMGFLFMAGFGASHAMAKWIGAWPSVFVVTILVAYLAWDMDKAWRKAMQARQAGVIAGADASTAAGASDGAASTAASTASTPSHEAGA